MKGSLSRRELLCWANSLALTYHASAALLFTDGNQPAPSTVIKTASGALRGEQIGDIQVFKGVPFAEPPVGRLRFRPPVKIKNWNGVRNAMHFAPAAMQAPKKNVPLSEDCLYLNIWAPRGKGPYPVFVWIHGGGFVSGRSFEPMFDGAEFARNGIVCVTIAYRLGVFGFLDLGPLLGNEYQGSANNGLRDIIESLQWVRQNIGAFGGDPSQVTIGGESAGAKLTDILMGVPSAKPLFHQMISESGGAERIQTRDHAGVISEAFGNKWRTLTGTNPAAIQTADAAELINVQRKFMLGWPQHFPLRIEVGGALVPNPPLQTICSGSSEGKRLLIGTDRDESVLFIGPHPAKDATAADLGSVSLDRFRDIFRRYRSVYPALSEEQLRIRALSAEEYWIPSIQVANCHVNAGGEAWMYRLDFSENSGRLRGYAFHSLDLRLVWDRPYANIKNAEEEAHLAQQMHQAWSAFIRGESPGAPGLPPWPPYKSDRRPTMIFDLQSRVEQKPQEAELRLWL